MKSYLFGAVSVLSLLAAGSAHAKNDDSGWYLRGNAGYGSHFDADLTGGINSNLHGNGLQSEGNPAYSLGGGYDFGDNWRVELDADSLKSSLGSISQTPSSKGTLRTDSLMLNALYDFNDYGKFEPYVGAGLGFVKGKGRFTSSDFPSVDNTLVVNPTCVGPRTAGVASACGISSSDSGFGWQLLAGLGYEVADNLTWDTHYSYLNGPDLDLQGHIANQVTNASSTFNSKLTDVGAHTLMTGLRYKFGGAKAAAPTKVIRPAVVPTHICWDGTKTFNSGQCSTQPAPVVETRICWDGSSVDVTQACADKPAPAPVQTYNCWDGTVVYDLASCTPQPVAQTVIQPNLNLCGSSPVAIFDVPVNSTPKQMKRLGTMPEFGDSHGLTPDQFYDKLNTRYSESAVDKAYLNYLFKSMGYSNGWADAQPYMFSEEVLPVGTRGMLGLGKQHHYSYSVLPSTDRDRQAFRIQSANGSVIHFMKTCGNYMYACE